MCIRDSCSADKGPSSIARSGRFTAVKPVIRDNRRFGEDASCLLYTSDAADERSSVDLGGRRIIKKKKQVDKDGGVSL